MFKVPTKRKVQISMKLSIEPSQNLENSSNDALLDSIQDIQNRLLISRIAAARGDDEMAVASWIKQKIFRSTKGEH